MQKWQVGILWYSKTLHRQVEQSSAAIKYED